MQTKGAVRAATVGTAALAGVLALACDSGTSRSEQGNNVVDAEVCDGTHDAGSSINACDDGSDACGSNEQCRSCLDEGACADGPDPVWTGTECVCADSPEHCQLTFCCVQGAVWNPGVCDCVGTP
jgi:hypothetical protein